MQNCMEMIWTIYEKFQIFIEWSGEKQERYESMSSRKCFPTKIIVTAPPELRALQQTQPSLRRINWEKNKEEEIDS